MDQENTIKPAIWLKCYDSTVACCSITQYKINAAYLVRGWLRLKPQTVFGHQKSDL